MTQYIFEDTEQYIHLSPTAITHSKIVGLCFLLIGSTLGKGKFWGGVSPKGLVW